MVYQLIQYLFNGLVVAGSFPVCLLCTVFHKAQNAGNKSIAVLKSVGTKGDCRHFQSLEQHADGCI